jgi:hypothetical protein
MALAIYNLWFQGVWLSLFGDKTGFGELTLGYFIVGIIGFTIAKSLVWGLKSEDKKKAEEA